MFRALSETPEQVDVITKFFYDNTKAPTAKWSYKPTGGERSALDIVRDVFGVVPCICNRSEIPVSFLSILAMAF